MDIFLQKKRIYFYFLFYVYFLFILFLSKSILFTYDALNASSLVHLQDPLVSLVPFSLKAVNYLLDESKNIPHNSSVRDSRTDR